MTQRRSQGRAAEKGLESSPSSQLRLVIISRACVHPLNKLVEALCVLLKIMNEHCVDIDFYILD